MNKYKNILINDAFNFHQKGVLFYAPYEGEFIEGVPSNGFGSIKYETDGSIYTGNLYYDGNHFNKIGYGQQAFDECNHGYFDYNGKKNKYVLYVGEFDYRQTDWIYGHGVLYCRDEFGAPSAFVKGFFSGLRKIDEWNDFDYSTLALGFKKEMEIPDISREDLKLKFIFYNKTLPVFDAKYNILFIGDSYLDFLRFTDYTGFDMNKELTKPYLDLAVGGTTAIEWAEFVDDINLKNDPANIVINAGFNDIHLDYSLDEIEKSLLTIVDKLKNKFKTSKIFVLNCCHCPASVNYLSIENSLNDFINKNETKSGYVSIDMASLLAKIGKSAFHDDNVHPSHTGYQQFYNFFHTLEK